MGQDGELGGADNQETLALAVENHRRGALLIIGHKTRAVHHKVALKVHARQHVLQLEVLLVGAEFGERVFVRLGLGREGFLHGAHDGSLEIVGIDEHHRVGVELRQLHVGRIVLQVGMAGACIHPAAFPREAAPLALPGLGEEIVGARGAVEGVLVGMVARSRDVCEVYRAFEYGAHIVTQSLQLEDCTRLRPPNRGARLIDGSILQQVGGILYKACYLLLLGGDGHDGRRGRQPFVEEGGGDLGTLVGHQRLCEVHIVGRGFHLGLAGGIIQVGYLLPMLVVEAVIRVLKTSHQLCVGSQLLLRLAGAVEVAQQL